MGVSSLTFKNRWISCMIKGRGEAWSDLGEWSPDQLFIKHLAGFRLGLCCLSHRKMVVTAAYMVPVFRGWTIFLCFEGLEHSFGCSWGQWWVLSCLSVNDSATATQEMMNLLLCW
jgi:hypothetical protein